MTIEQQIPDDAPIMVAWRAYKARPEYANSRRWAQTEDHVDGSMWAAFYAGYWAGMVKFSETIPDCPVCGGKEENVRRLGDSSIPHDTEATRRANVAERLFGDE